MTRPATPAALLAAVTASLVLSGCGPDAAASDDVLEGRDTTVRGTSTAFVVPTGTMTVTVGEPVAQVDADDTADRVERSAPDGSSLLPVGVDFAYGEGAPWGGRLAGPPQESAVTVTVDGERRDLGSPYRAGGQALSGSAAETFYVVVPGEPTASDVEVEVAYDGASQSATAGAEATGAAAALAALPTEAPTGADCPPDGWGSTGAPLSVECDLPLVGRTPYWPGSGWAPEGSEWVVVGADRLQVYPAPGSDQEVRTVEGVGAAEQLGHGAYGPTGLDGVVVVDSGALTGGTLPLELSVTLDGDSTPVRLSQDVPVPVTGP